MNGEALERRLESDVVSALELNSTDRVAFLLQDRWVRYPSATNIANALSQIISHPNSRRMPGAAIVGRPDNGKTTLVRRFIDQHPPRYTEDGIRTPIVFCHMPASPDEAKFWTGLLTKLQIAHRPDATLRKLQNQATRVLAEMHARVLVIDEFHHLGSSPAKQQEHVLAALKNLSSDMHLSLVLVGTQALIGALRADEQLATRLRPYVLPHWRPNSDYQRLLSSFERHLPLKRKSGLAGGEIAREIHNRSMATIGGTKDVIVQSAIIAIESGEEAITPEIVRSVEVVTHHDFNTLMRQV